MLVNVRAGGVSQGGSSISQQLAKNLFLTNERTIERKVKEAFLAIWLELRLTKNEILKLTSTAPISAAAPSASTRRRNSISTSRRAT